MIAHLHSYKVAVIAILSIGLSLQSCTKVDASDGQRETKRFDLPDFEKISFETGGKLNYVQGGETSVSVTTTPEVLAALEIEVKKKTLYIKRKGGYNIVNSQEIVFDVVDDDTYDFYSCGSGDIRADFDESYEFDFHQMKVSGSGSITCDYVNAFDQVAKVSGSGNIFIGQLITPNSLSKITGSGDISYGGTADYSDVEIHGSGSFESFDFTTTNSSVFNCGSGSAQVRAINALDAEISGSGDVSYKGFPSLFTDITGTGTLINAN